MLENAHDAVAGAWSRDDDDDGHLSTNDESRQTGVLTDPVMGIVRICSGPAYEMFKAGLVSYHCARMGYSDCRNHSQSLQLFTSKTLSTLSPKTATVAEKCDCRRKRRLSQKSAAVALFGDSRRFLRQAHFSATVAVFGRKLSPKFKSAPIVASVDRL